MRPRTIRLLWLIDSLTLGGAESLLIPFAGSLDRARYELSVCCLSTVGGNPIERELVKQGVEVKNLGARSLRDRAAFHRLTQLVRDGGIDLIHAHLTYSAIWSALLSRKTGIPSIASLHVTPSATREVQSTMRQRFMTDIRDWLMRRAVNRWSSAVITVSEFLRDHYLARGGIDRSKIRVVHNGIDVQRLDRDRGLTRARLLREFDLPAGAPIIVTVSVLRPGKGIEFLLEAARRVTNGSFLIIGDGPKRQEWSELARRIGVSERIRWAGYRSDVDAILAGCDLFAHPSLHDAFPTVLLEALAAGLPIVASDVGGIPEIVDANTGRLVPPGNADTLAREITTLLGEPATLAAMRAAAKATAARRFSTAAWMERLMSVYEEVLRDADAA